MKKVAVEYDHDSADLNAIELAVTKLPKPDGWTWAPAYRDTEHGKRCVWARFDVEPGTSNVWIRDKNGERLAGTVTN